MVKNKIILRPSVVSCRCPIRKRDWLIRCIVFINNFHIKMTNRVYLFLCTKTLCANLSRGYFARKNFNLEPRTQFPIIQHLVDHYRIVDSWWIVKLFLGSHHLEVKYNSSQKSLIKPINLLLIHLIISDTNTNTFAKRRVKRARGKV